MSTRQSSAPGLNSTALTALQRRIWDGSLPLEIRLSAADCRTYDDSDPYLINVPRLSYLPFLLQRLFTFFSPSLINPGTTAPHEAWLSFDGLPLKWHYPIGLLYDLFSGAAPAGLDREPNDAANDEHSNGDGSTGREGLLPWRLTVHYAAYPADLLLTLDAAGRVLQDAYINAVKEADFVRNGTAKAVMSLSKADSDMLWTAVAGHDLRAFESVNTKLWNPPGISLRHIPLKLYLPTARPRDAPLVELEEDPNSLKSKGKEGAEEGAATQAQPGSVRVVQGLVPLLTTAAGGRQAAASTTLGVALNSLLPTVFPSRRNPVLALPVLHGAVVPMTAHLADLGRAASYTDGFLHVVVVLLS